MIEDMLLTVAKGVSMEPFPFLIMVLLCTIAAYMLALMVPSPTMTMFGFPMLLTGSLLANWVFVGLRLQAVADKHSNSVVATALGLICTLLVIMILTQVTSFFDPVPEREESDEIPGRPDKPRR